MSGIICLSGSSRKAVNKGWENEITFKAERNNKKQKEV